MCGGNVVLLACLLGQDNHEAIRTHARHFLLGKTTGLYAGCAQDGFNGPILAAIKGTEASNQLGGAYNQVAELHCQAVIGGLASQASRFVDATYFIFAMYASNFNSLSFPTRRSLWA